MEEIKLIYDAVSNTVYLNGARFRAQRHHKKSCEDCHVPSESGKPCRVGDRMLDICFKCDSELGAYVIWQRVDSPVTPPGMELAESVLGTIDNIAPNFTPDMLEVFVGRMREGIDRLEKHGECLNNKVPF